MNKNLLILGAGQYGQVARETAQATGQFDKIDFLDDNNKEAVGKLSDYEDLPASYSFAIVAIGNPKIRLEWIGKLKEAGYNIATLIHPKSHVSPSADVMQGCIVEPMAVVNTGAVVREGCIVSAGAVVNHNSICYEGAHIDCNATVAANAEVPSGVKVCSGEVFKKA